MEQADIAQLEKKTFILNVNGEDVTINLSDVEIISEDIPGWLVENQDKLTVALDINITEDLLKEGIGKRVCEQNSEFAKVTRF